MAGRLVGVCGLNVDPYAGDARVGRVRHLYVLTPMRRHGVGRQLVTEVIRAAGGRFDSLRLRTNNPAAARLYEVLGFRAHNGAGEYTHVMTSRGDRVDSGRGRGDSWRAQRRDQSADR